MGNAKARGNYEERVRQAIAAGRVQKRSAYGLMAPIYSRKERSGIVRGFFTWWASHLWTPKPSRSWRTRTTRGLRTQDRRMWRNKTTRRVNDEQAA